VWRVDDRRVPSGSSEHVGDDTPGPRTHTFKPSRAKVETMPTPTLDRITVYPVKSLDGHDLDRATVLEAGGLSHDREWAIADARGDYVTGKRNRPIHRLRSTFDPGRRLALRETGREEVSTFDLDEPDRLQAWLSEFFGEPVTLDRNERGGFPDDTHAAGPTVISTATLEAVAGWFDLPVEDVRRRFRANLEVGGVPAFWEDRLYTDPEHVVAFRVGPVTFEGVNPCQRCAVPSRDPDTGAETPGFRERFVEKRAATLPEWADRAWFDHYYRLMVNTRVPEESVRRELGVGDAIELVEERPA
jgi:uncharacterized protein YcbX